MSELFDNVAGKFAGDIDQAMKAGRYVRGEYFVSLARRFIPAGASVLDYGCGPGRLSRLLLGCGYGVFGVDTSAGMIEQARSLVKPGENLSFAVIDKAEDSMSPGRYDAIVCSSVIEYVPDADGLLRQFAAALKGPRVLVISFANSASRFRQQWEREAESNPMGPSQHHTWDAASFTVLLQRNGFEVLSAPLYYESPWDWRCWGGWFKRSARIGSLGVVAARVRGTPAH